MSLPHFTKELHGSKRIIYEKIALSEISAIFFCFWTRPNHHKYELSYWECVYVLGLG